MKKTLLLLAILPLMAFCQNKTNVEQDKKHFQELVKNQDKFDKYKLRNKLWHISEIIGYDTSNNQEFTLYKVGISEKFVYGTSIKFNADNTFEDAYHAKCGNDCFPSSTGNYIFIDENHINIKVKNFQQMGDCEAKSITFNTGYVTYYIFQTPENNLKLIKSNGKPEDDKLNEYYSSEIDKYFGEVRNGSSSLLNFKTNSTSNIDRVDEFVRNKTQVKHYKILYTKKQDDLFLINFVKNLDAENDYFFVVNGFRNNYDYQVGYYKLKKNAEAL